MKIPKPAAGCKKSDIRPDNGRIKSCDHWYENKKKISLISGLLPYTFRLSKTLVKRTMKH